MNDASQQCACRALGAEKLDDGASDCPLTSVVITGIDSREVFKLGSMSPNGNYFAGSLDDVAVYNRKLTATEIKQLYEQTVSKR